MSEINLNIGGIQDRSSQFAYSQTEYDPVKNKNDAIDKYSADVKQYFTNLANYENKRLDPKKSRLAELASFSKSVAKQGVPVINWAREFRDMNKFIQLLNENGEDADEVYDKQEELRQDQVRSEANQIAGENDQFLLPQEIHELHTVEGRVTNRLSELFRTKEAVKEIGLSMETIDGILRHDLGKEGQPLIKVLNDTTSIEEWDYMKIRNMAFLAHQLKGVAPNGMLKRYVYRELYRKYRADRVAFLTAQEKVVKEHYREQRASEVALRIEEDPTFVGTYIEMHKGAIGTAQAKREIFNIANEAVESGFLDGSDIENIKAVKIKPWDGSAETTIGEYFKPQIRELESQLQKVQKQEILNIESDEKLAKAKLKDKQLDFLRDQKGPVTNDQIQSLIEEWQEVFPDKRIPEHLGNYLTAEVDDALERDYILQQRYMNGETLRVEDYWGIKDPTIFDKWQQRIGGPGMNAEAKGLMEKWIRPIINTHRNENDGPMGKAKSIQWEANMYNGTQAYVAVYQAAKTRGLSDTDAHSEARRAVLAGLNSGEFDTFAHTEKSDISRTNLLRSHRKLINKDPNVIDSSELLEGEDEPILAAARYFSKNPNQKNLPEYFYQITRGMKISPYQYAKRRLVATGRLKDGELVFPEEKNLDAYDQEKLSYHPSDSRTYQVTQDNEDITWMLDLLKENSPAIANGEYQSIRNPDGEYVELERPITELTVGEVLELVNLGYTNIGMYDLKPQALKQVVAMGGLQYDDIFDENTQDLIVLARLRYKANTRNNTRGIVNQYRRLVHIDKEDHAEFVRIAGDLPPWLRLENLIPDAAKAVVDETLNN